MNLLFLTNVLVVILSGGKSKRIGFDKHLIKVGKLSILDITLNNLFNMGFKNIIISGKTKGYSYFDDNYNCFGSLNGFFSVFLGCMNINYDFYLFITIDMPFLTKNVILKLIRNYNSDGAVVYYNRNFPLLISNSFEARKIIKYFLYTNSVEFSVCNFLNRIYVKKIYYSANFRINFLNINTIFDLSLFYKSIFHC